MCVCVCVCENSHKEIKKHFWSKLTEQHQRVKKLNSKKKFERHIFFNNLTRHVWLNAITHCNGTICIYQTEERMAALAK